MLGQCPPGQAPQEPPAESHADSGCSLQVKRRVVVADQYRRPRRNAQTSVSTSASGQQLSSTPQVPRRYAKQWYDQQHPTLTCPLDPPPRWESLTLPPHRAELIRGKHGVEMTSEYDQGNGNIRFPVVPGEPRTVTVLVQNRGTEVVTLQRFQAQQQARELSFTDEQGAVQGQSLLLHPGRVCPVPCPVPCPAQRMQDPVSPFTVQVGCTPSRCAASPPAMGTSVLWCPLSSPRSQTNPSASHATSLPLLRASWPRTWGPQHLSSPTRPASSAMSQSSQRMASPLTGM